MHGLPAARQVATGPTSAAEQESADGNGALKRANEQPMSSDAGMPRCSVALSSVDEPACMMICDGPHR